MPKEFPQNKEQKVIASFFSFVYYYRRKPEKSNFPVTSGTCSSVLCPQFFTVQRYPIRYSAKTQLNFNNRDPNSCVLSPKQSKQSKGT